MQLKIFYGIWNCSKCYCSNCISRDTVSLTRSATDLVRPLFKYVLWTWIW